MSGWRIMFLGQGPVAESGYARLLDLDGAGGVRVPVACSNPCDEETWWGSARIQELASKHSTVFISNAQRNDDLLLASAAEHAVNCLISVGHPWILPKRLLLTVEGGAAFNLHNGPLPEFGGFHTCAHAILKGATHFGPTLHWMDPLPDAGPIAFQERFAIPHDATAKALHTLTLESGKRLLTRLIEDLLQERLPPRIPMEGSPTIYPRRALDEHREISDISDDVEVDRKSRAFWFPPFEPAFFRAKGTKYYVVPSHGATDLGDLATIAPPA